MTKEEFQDLLTEKGWVITPIYTDYLSGGGCETLTEYSHEVSGLRFSAQNIVSTEGTFFETGFTPRSPRVTTPETGEEYFPTLDDVIQIQTTLFKERHTTHVKK